MTLHFHVDWRDEESARTVWASGEVDIATVDEFRRALECEQRRLRIDLSNVSFMDLAGLKCLLDAAERCDSVSLTTSHRVDRLLQLTATDHLFQIQ